MKVSQYKYFECYLVANNFILKICGIHLLYRGYYMAARGYEFYIRVLKAALTTERSERVRDTLPKRPCNVLFII